MNVVVTDERGRPVRARGLASWLMRAAPRRARGTVSVAIVSDARVRALNRRYRRKNYATDVLSFPADAGLKSSATPAGIGTARLRPRSRQDVTQGFSPASFLGDIVIARGVAARQARAAGHGAMVELRILALHGLLHLLGYDHERDDGRMRMVEARLLRRSGVDAGLIERAARGSTGSPRAVKGRARPRLVDQPPRVALRRSAVAPAKAEGRAARR
jgi:probable rRNA maturation factor